MRFILNSLEGFQRLGNVCAKCWHKITWFVPPIKTMKGAGDLMHWFLHTGVIGAMLFIITGDKPCSACKHRRLKWNEKYPFHNEQSKIMQDKGFRRKGNIIEKRVLAARKLIGKWQFDISENMTLKFELFEKHYDRVTADVDEPEGMELLQERNNIKHKV